MALKLNKFKSLFVVTENIDETKNQKTEDQKNSESKKSTPENKSEQNIVPENKRSGSKMSWKTSTNQNNNDQKTEIITENNTTQISNEGEFNQKIFDQLTQAISDANLPGEDYIEFMEALSAMKNLNLDENIKIQTVFATLSTKGLTKEKVIESAGYYLKVLENEKTKFYEVLDSHMKGQINSKHNEITQLENGIKEKEDMLITLQEEIKQSKQVVLKIKNDIQEADGKIKKTENDFLITYKKISESIINKTEKIKNI